MVTLWAVTAVRSAAGWQDVCAPVCATHTRHAAVRFSVPVLPSLLAPVPPAPRRLGDVVSLVCDMAEGGLRPDSSTFSAIFNACQRADEAELALDVARSVARLLRCCRQCLPPVCWCQPAWGRVR